MYGPMTSFHLQCAPLYDRQQQSFLSAEQQSVQCHTLYQKHSAVIEHHVGFKAKKQQHWTASIHTGSWERK